jgi:predicted DNA-binding transcriptional regulator YafY
MLNLALDRIQTIEEHSDEYRENKSIDFGTYYSDVIGVTKSPGQRDTQVVFWIDDANAPYVITKPLHHTQKVVSEENGGKVFTIRVIMNFELERELLGFGPKIKVLGPRILVKQMKMLLQKSLNRYEVPSPIQVSSEE